MFPLSAPVLCCLLFRNFYSNALLGIKIAIDHRKRRIKELQYRLLKYPLNSQSDENQRSVYSEDSEDSIDSPIDSIDSSVYSEDSMDSEASMDSEDSLDSEASMDSEDSMDSVDREASSEVSSDFSSSKKINIQIYYSLNI